MNQSNIFLRNIIFSILTLCIILSPVSSANSPVDNNDKVYKVVNKGTMYTAYNLWYEPGKEDAMWCINYKTGDIIPAGTEVTNIRIVQPKSGKYLGGVPRAISFKTVEDGKVYLVNFKQAFHPDRTIDDYLELMFTSEDFAQLTEGLDNYEIEAIKEGKAKINMSKEAMLLCYGYPPEHRTRDLEKDKWIYWMNRFQSKEIFFNEQGLTYRPVSDPDEL